MLPHHSGWVAAFVLTLLLAAVGAASEHEPLTAAALKARASAGADVDGVASIEASLDASVEASASSPFDHGLRPLRPAPERPLPPAPSGDETDETAEANGTETAANETPAATPVPNETADMPASLEPREQNIRGQAGAPIRFVLLLTNTADTAQNVSLSVKSPVSWGVRLSPDAALLGADETVPIHGTIDTPALIGTSGTIAIFARGDGGEDVSYVNLCTIGVLQAGCAPGTEGDGRDHGEDGAAPDRTHEDPAPAPQPEPTPAGEASEPSPSASGTEDAPPPAPEPADSGAASPSNSTSPASEGGDDPTEGSATVEPSLTIEVTASKDEEDG